MAHFSYSECISLGQTPAAADAARPQILG